MALKRTTESEGLRHKMKVLQQKLNILTIKLFDCNG
jgi:hypothetical protein